MSEPLGRSAAVGTLWLTGQKWVVRLSGFVTIAILTRLLSPEDFGVVAAASTITPMILLLGDLGLSAYIAQADSVDAKMLSTAFWFSAVSGVVLGVGLVVSAPLIAAAFNIDEATEIVRGMALSVLVTVTAGVPIALLRRELRFRLLAVQTGIASAIGQAIAIGLAVAGAGPWALVAQLVATQGIACGLAWHSAGWWPSRQFSFSSFSTMARFGGPAAGGDLLGMARGMLEAAIISNALGAAALGFMSIGQRLVQVAQDAAAGAMIPVSSMIFAKVRNSPDRLRTAYLRALRIGYAAVAPALTFIAVDAATIIPVVFGDEWGESVAVTQGLAIAAILGLGAMIDHGLHFGMAAMGRWFVYQLVIGLLMLGTTFVVAPYGLAWVSVGFVVTALIATMLRWVVVGHLVSHSVLGLASVFAISMLPVAVSALAGLAVEYAASGLSPLGRMVLVGLTVALVHLVTLRLVSRAVLSDALSLLPIPASLAWIKRLA